MQSLLRLLSSLMMTNYPPHMVTGKASTDGWEAISNEGMNKVEELKPCKMIHRHGTKNGIRMLNHYSKKCHNTFTLIEY